MLSVDWLERLGGGREAKWCGMMAPIIWKRMKPLKLASQSPTTEDRPLQVNPINLRVIATTKSKRSHEINYKMEIEGFVCSDKFFNYHGPSDCKFIQTKHDLAILIYGPASSSESFGQRNERPTERANDQHVRFSPVLSHSVSWLCLYTSDFPAIQCNIVYRGGWWGGSVGSRWADVYFNRAFDH